MSLVHIATRCTSDWRSRLGDPEKHWRRKYSAMETAMSWELAVHTDSGMPKPISKLFQAGELTNPKLLLAIAEHKVPLMGKGGDAQCDVWALADTDAGLVSISVEAKAREPFGSKNESLEDWLKGGKSTNSGENREKRWHHIKANLPPLANRAYHHVPYQILQRATAGVIEARRFKLSHAVFLVQAFNAPKESLEMYTRFAHALGVNASRDELAYTSVDNIQFSIGWADCPFASDTELAAAFANEPLEAGSPGCSTVLTTGSLSSALRDPCTGFLRPICR
jgi:hypothetical protein